MSRCFPFPPPGYEIQASPDNVNSILKEKHKHKKRKDKKDKDEKEKKERREKKREGKHKDGKDRKEKKKHRDDKDKKKDKLKSSEEKKIVGCFENQNSDKFVPDDSKSIEKIEDNKILAELGKRVRDDGGATDNQTVDKKIILVERKHEKNGFVEKRELMANGNILKVEANGSRNGFVGNIFAEKIEGGLEKIQKRNEGKEKNENGNGVGENDRSKNEDRDKKREEKKRKKERKKEKKMEKEKKKEMKQRSKENIKQRENDTNVVFSRDNNPSDRLKENGFLHEDNGFRPNNTSRADQVTQNGSGFHPSPQSIGNLAVVEKAVIKDHQKINVITNHVEKEAVITNQKFNIITTNQKINGEISSNSNNHGMNNGFISLHLSANSTKVKQIMNNNHSADDKFPPFIENGRKPDDKEKELKMNGVLEGKMDISSMPSIKTKEKKARISTKPPHPDLKYLNQILTVPKLDFPPQFDDQDWLFGYKDSQAKRPKLASVNERTHKQVWAEAIVMGPADVIALPYVIPY